MDDATVLRVKASYLARAFALRPDEQIQRAAYADLDRRGRAQTLIQLSAGDRLPRLTSPSDGGMIYAEASKDGSRYAVLLLPDSYE